MSSRLACLARLTLIVAVVCLVGGALPALDLPAPTEWAAPAGAPPAPGDRFAITAAGRVAATAPVIAEWNRTAKPDESLTLTGIRFSRRSGVALGSDTRVLIYGWTTGGGVVKEAKLWQVSDQLIVATVPADLPFGMYLLWVENQDGASAPVVLNRPQPEWVGPLGDRAAPGQTKRVFGKNLSRDHGEQSSNVYLRPAGGGALIACAVTRVEPCAVWFTVPTTLAAGAYEVWVHSGHGGVHGWGGPVPLTVAPAWERGNDVRTLAATSGDQTAALQAAIDALTALPGGGTVRLGSGTFVIGGKLMLKDQVRLVGAGQTKTIIEPTGKTHIVLASGARHLGFEDLTIRPTAGASMTMYSASVSGGDFNADVLLRRCSLLVNSDRKSSLDPSFQCDGLEVDACLLEGVIHGSAIAWWIHDCELHGGRGATDGALSFRSDRSMGGVHGRYVIEDNRVKTPAWPNKGGNRNYQDWMSGEEWNGLLWCARLIYFQPSCESICYGYIGHNTTEDVAIDSNKGEQILFHSFESASFAGVASAGPRTLTIRTDGVCQGVTDLRINPVSTPTGITPMRRIPDALNYGSAIDGSAWAVIMDGVGLGQARRIVSHTATSLTLDGDWRVPPDATSTVVLMHAYVGHIQYGNRLAGVPVGWRHHEHIASTGVNYDGNCFFCVAENNTNTRTYYGDQIQGYVTAPSYWNEMRNSQTITPVVNGAQINARGGDWGIAPTTVRVPGPLCLGDWLRGGSSDLPPSGGSIVEGWGALPANRLFTIGCGIEGMRVTSGGIGIASYVQLLARNNTLVDKPVIQVGKYGEPWLAGNRSTAITGDGASHVGVRPVPTQRVVAFTAATLSTPQTVEVANTGFGAMAWTVSSDQPWVQATAQSGASPEAGEAVSGRLVVSIVAASLPTGTQHALLTLTAGSQQATVGVVVRR